MAELGLKDIPIESKEDESLGIGDYADVLSTFIEECDTPMTIALQGDWGSGKTSLMRLIDNALKEGSSKSLTVWFNTWQYSQFEMADSLALSMMSHFIDKLNPGESNKNAKFTKGLLVAAKALAMGGASLIGQSSAAKTVMDEMAKNNQDIISDPSIIIAQLKENLEASVRETISADNSINRVVVFIDDLDRLIPVKAVELLESLKLFMDIQQCVYVIACDYNVVLTGLKTKFGVDDGAVKGKSFFDKIIQLPFNMPTNHYDVDGYIEKLLGKINVAYDEEDIEVYRRLIMESVGFNPRTIKRIFNSLLLLNIVAEKKQLYKNDENARSQEKVKVLFGILCMQTEYSAVYEYLIRQDIGQQLLENLKNEVALTDDDKYTELLKELGITEKDSSLSKFTLFMETFYQCIQLRSDDDFDNVSESELKNLKVMLNFSGVVSTGKQASEVDQAARRMNRRMANDLVKSLTPKYKEDLTKISKGLHVYQARGSEAISIYLYKLPLLDYKINLEFEFDKEEMSAYFYPTRDKDIEFLDKIIGTYIVQLLPETKKYSSEEECAFIRHQKFDVQQEYDDKVQQYKDMIISIMDKLAPELPDICEQVNKD